jgi:ribosomal protein S18 acetylase RimI-like enzyme
VGPASEVVIERGDVGDLDRLEPLWTALMEHHAGLYPHLPQRSREESWRRRRAQYAKWLSRGDSFFMVARRDEELLGYAMVELGEGSPMWDMGERAAELQSLVVLPDERHHHVGTALLESADHELEQLGVHNVLVEIMAANREGIAFYERRGYTPYCSVLHRSRPAREKTTAARSRHEARRAAGRDSNECMGDG